MMERAALTYITLSGVIAWGMFVCYKHDTPSGLKANAKIGLPTHIVIFALRGRWNNAKGFNPLLRETVN